MIQLAHSFILLRASSDGLSNIGQGCHGLRRLQKNTFTFLVTVKLLYLTIPSPRSQVNDRRSDAGSCQMCRLSAATTAEVQLLRTFACRNTK